MATITIVEPTLDEIRQVVIHRAQKKYTVDVVLRTPAGDIVTVQNFTFPFGAAFETVVNNFLTNNTIPDIKAQLGFS
jgi:hypothetical protein